MTHRYVSRGGGVRCRLVGGRHGGRGLDIGNLASPGAGTNSGCGRDRRLEHTVLSRCLGILVTTEEDQQTRDDEGGGNGNTVQTDLVEGRNRQQGGEDECLGVQPATNADDDAAHETADQHGRVDPFVPQVDTVQTRFRDAAEQASRQGTDGRLSHGLLVIADRQGQHPGRCPEAGEVPCPHRPLDVVITQGLDVEQHDGVEWPVQAQWHHERVGQRNDDGEDEWTEGVDGSQPLGQVGTQIDADRADEEGRQRDHDEQ